jgi:hypothetical protein
VENQGICSRRNTTAAARLQEWQQQAITDTQSSRHLRAGSCIASLCAALWPGPRCGVCGVRAWRFALLGLACPSLSLSFALSSRRSAKGGKVMRRKASRRRPHRLIYKMRPGVGLETSEQTTLMPGGAGTHTWSRS